MASRKTGPGTAWGSMVPREERKDGTFAHGKSGVRQRNAYEYKTMDTNDNSWNTHRKKGSWTNSGGNQTTFDDWGDSDLSNNMNDMRINDRHSDRQQRDYKHKSNNIMFATGRDGDLLAEQERIERAKEWAAIDFTKASADSAKYVREKWAQYPDIVKVVYEEHPDVKNWSERDAEYYRKHSNEITVQVPPGMENETNKPKVPKPISQFRYAFINYPEIQKLLLEAGFDEPSPIQAQAWPLIMQGFDTIGIAQTGTGKTLAFLLPAYVHILEQKKLPGRVPGANVLIMAPTRELAQQIHKEVGKFNYAGCRSVCVYGGIERKKQIAEVNKGCNILIATPGRLDDFIMSENIDITTVTFVVLDEADRMLDCGFEPQIRKTMYKIRPDRQTIMTSATWPSGVQRLANSYMKDPIQVVIGSLDLSAVNSVEQQFEFVENDPEIKLDYLLDFIVMNNTNPDLKAMVFATSKATAAYVSSEIAFRNISCSSIRGDMEQTEREYAIESIKDGEVKFLVATDVASRGIDIPNLTHVINFDFPRDIEEYVHRVGRTGRAGKTGIALTYFTRRDSKHAEELIKILEKANQTVPPTLYKYAEDHSRRSKRFDNKRPHQGRGRYDYNF